MMGIMKLENRSGVGVMVRFNYDPEKETVKLLPNRDFDERDIAGVSYFPNTLKSMALVSIREWAESQ